MKNHYARLSSNGGDHVTLVAIKSVEGINHTFYYVALIIS